LCFVKKLFKRRQQPLLTEHLLKSTPGGVFMPMLIKILQIFRRPMSQANRSCSLCCGRVALRVSNGAVLNIDYPRGVRGIETGDW
ncbi:hypothetical protein BgiBS90_031521, partial [Biomphalaria glabrata]